MAAAECCGACVLVFSVAGYGAPGRPRAVQRRSRFAPQHPGAEPGALFVRIIDPS